MPTDASAESRRPPLEQAVADIWPLENWTNVGVVIGISGGADSVALARALQNLAIGTPGFLIAAHFNHQLRGEHSDQDQVFTCELAQRLGVRVFTGSAAEFATDQPRPTSEAALADQRRRFLIETAKQTGARYIALAHHRDDNVETFLHHMMRGTGPSGLCGMPVFRSLDSDLVLVRPLLRVSRPQILDYLESLEQDYRLDHTNELSLYTRNWIRNEWLPMGSQRFPQASEAIGRTIETLAQWREVIDQAADRWATDNIRFGPPHRITRDPSTPSAIVVAAIQRLWDRSGWSRGEMNQRHWSAIIDRINGSQQDRQILPCRIDVQVDANHVWLHVSAPHHSS
jgi:tRNA(Ile)-lysidine synthase